MQDFKHLRVWETAHQLVLVIYRVTAHFPKEEQYGLTSQLRRAATSVPSNIAEGCGRDSDGDFARFLRIAQGSANEVEYQLFLASDLGYLDAVVYGDLARQIAEAKRMLNAFIQRVDPKKPRAKS
ncbi:MAG: four helix bundle protein [Bacteroidota bacterium]